MRSNFDTLMEREDVTTGSHTITVVKHEEEEEEEHRDIDDDVIFSEERLRHDVIFLKSDFDACVVVFFLCCLEDMMGVVPGGWVGGKGDLDPELDERAHKN